MFSEQTSPELIAKNVVRGHLFASIKMLNAVNKALGYDIERALVVCGSVQMHIAEKVATDNLSEAPSSVLLKAIMVQEKRLAAQDLRRIKRIGRGRTRGAGAGGYNRDIDNIKHHIDDAKMQIALIRGELSRRADSCQPAS